MALTIDIVSDVICPWCWLGKHRLAAALAQRPDLEVDVRWHPFQLDPGIPPEGAPHRERLVRKFGDPAVLDAAQARLANMGSMLGLEYHFDRIARTPYTVPIHVLVRAARAHGGAALEHALVERFFAAYFSEGVDLTAPGAVLAQAESAGLPRPAAEDALADASATAAVLAEMKEWAARGVTGVPTFVFGERFAMSGAQPVETFAQALGRAS
jgi:predicted DsbA family dithiol-disulfide isomerase